MRTKTVNIERVKKQFSQWRLKKGSSKAPIPESLWQAAVSLYGPYRSGQITKELKLEGRKFRLKIAQLKGKKELRDRDDAFIEMTLPVTEAESEASCEWERGDGSKLRVKVPSNQLASLVSSFLGGGL
jgi:hypothetical protein